MNSANYFTIMLLLISAILFACASAHENLIKGPVGSVSKLLKSSHIYKLVDRFYEWKKFQILERLNHDISNEIYSSIENFNEYLQPFENCFVYIKNDRNIEIQPTTIPIVLAEIETQLWESNYTSTKYGYTETRASEYIQNIQKQSQTKHSPNEKLKPSDFNCTSEFLAKSSRNRFYNGDCLLINHTKFVTKIRPWNCEVHFDNFVSIYRTKYQRWIEFDENNNKFFMSILCHWICGITPKQEIRRKVFTN